jgi:hypothetical protein
MRYAVRKRNHKWAVCANSIRILEFENFDDAFMVAWNAARILMTARRSNANESPQLELRSPCPQAPVIVV